MRPCPHSQVQGETDGEAEWHNTILGFTHTMSYGDCLKLDKVLDAQFPLSPDRSEMLLIIQRQASRLWVKLMFHELRAAREHVRSDELGPALKMLARVSWIFGQLIYAWVVLATMTSTEYSTIRPYLGRSSGFQPYQYREIEFILGSKNATLLKPYAHHAGPLVTLEQALHMPLLYDEAIHLMVVQGLPVSWEQFARDAVTGTCYEASMETTWRQVHQTSERRWDLYQLTERLIDLEDSLRQWHLHHVTTVEHIIGFKPDTNGTEGVGYLRNMLDTVLFPEPQRLRSDLWHRMKRSIRLRLGRCRRLPSPTPVVKASRGRHSSTSDRFGWRGGTGLLRGTPRVDRDDRRQHPSHTRSVQRA